MQSAKAKTCFEMNIYTSFSKTYKMTHWVLFYLNKCFNYMIKYSQNRERTRGPNTLLVTYDLPQKTLVPTIIILFFVKSHTSSPEHLQCWSWDLTVFWTNKFEWCTTLQVLYIRSYTWLSYFEIFVWSLKHPFLIEYLCWFKANEIWA